MGPSGASGGFPGGGTVVGRPGVCCRPCLPRCSRSGATDSKTLPQRPGASPRSLVPVDGPHRVPLWAVHADRAVPHRLGARSHRSVGAAGGRGAPPSGSRWAGSHSRYRCGFPKVGSTRSYLRGASRGERSDGGLAFSVSLSASDPSAGSPAHSHAGDDSIPDGHSLIPSASPGLAHSVARAAVSGPVDPGGSQRSGADGL